MAKKCNSQITIDGTTYVCNVTHRPCVHYGIHKLCDIHAYMVRGTNRKREFQIAVEWVDEV